MIMSPLHSFSNIASDRKTTDYSKGLDEVMLPGVKEVTAGRSYIWQHDSASCHAKRTQSLLGEIFFDLINPNIWTTNTPLIGI